VGVIGGGLKRGDDLFLSDSATGIRVTEGKKDQLKEDRLVMFLQGQKGMDHISAEW